jgi:MFS family permease
MNRERPLLGILIYILAALFLLYEMALQVSPSIMTRDLMYDFHVGARALGIMASVYFWSYTLMQIPVGLLFDRFSGRILLTGAVFICSIGALFFALTHHVVTASFSRFLMGVGSAFAFVGTLVMAARWFSPKYFAFLVGTAQFLAALGALGGEFPLASMLIHWQWRSVMIFLGGIGIFLTLFSFLIIRDHPHEERDVPKRHDLIRELKEIIRSGQTWIVALYAFCGWAPVAVFAALWGVPYLRLRFQVSNTHAAMAIALLWVGLALTSPFIGWLSDKMGRRKALLTLCPAIGLISSLILFYFPTLSFAGTWIPLFGIGVAASGQILSFALVKDNNRPIVVGTAVSLNNMAVVAGGALFQPLVGLLLQKFWDGAKDGWGVPIYSVDNYHLALLIVPLCFAMSLLTSLFLIQETYCRPKHN